MLTIARNGPDGVGPVFKAFARSHINNGPGQDIDISSLRIGRTYRVTAKFFLEDGAGAPFACQPSAHWATPYFCPWFTIYVTQPWGRVKWNFANRNREAVGIGWYEFETEFTVSTRIGYPEKAKAYFRGPAKDIVIYFNEVTTTLTTDLSENELVVPARNTSITCTNYCCEMVRNGDAEVSVDFTDSFEKYLQYFYVNTHF